jgi:CyaY protein
MDDRAYQNLADIAFRRIEDAFKDVDPDQADLERAGDVITFTFPGNKRCVINTQRPTHQIWLAANAQAWHFSYSEASKTWLDDKRPDTELFFTLTDIVSKAGGVTVPIL